MDYGIAMENLKIGTKIRSDFMKIHRDKKSDYVKKIERLKDDIERRNYEIQKEKRNENKEKIRIK